MRVRCFPAAITALAVILLTGCGSDGASATSPSGGDSKVHDAGSSDTAAGPGQDGTSDMGGSDVSDSAQVHIRGVAYRFGPGDDDEIAGATIGVVELPGLATQTDAQGRYDLAVPLGATVTPQISAPGYHAMTLQTFEKLDKDLENLHFQTPSDEVFSLLAKLVGVSPDDEHCIIASTTSTKAIQGLTYDQFRAFGAHGVAGATAHGQPDLPQTIYFNAMTIPDKKLAATTADGGVLWTAVPPGIYTVGASHATKKFATFTATCVGGRLINANPPWGLKEL